MYGSLDALADIVSFCDWPPYKKKGKKEKKTCFYLEKQGHSSTHPNTQNNHLILQPKPIDCRMSDNHLAVSKHNKHHNNRA